MLQGKLTLYDIRDVEAFCERAIQRSGLTEFGYLDREDLLSECVTFVWKLSLDTSSVRSSFSGFAGQRLARFIVDWKRSDFRTRWVFGDGRIHERERPSFVDIDEQSVDQAAVDLGERSEADSGGLDAAGSVSAAAYFPPTHLRSPRRVERSLDPAPASEGRERQAA